MKLSMASRIGAPRKPPIRLTPEKLNHSHGLCRRLSRNIPALINTSDTSAMREPDIRIINTLPPMPIAFHKGCFSSRAQAK